MSREESLAIFGPLTSRTSRLFSTLCIYSPFMYPQLVVSTVAKGKRLMKSNSARVPFAANNHKNICKTTYEYGTECINSIRMQTHTTAIARSHFMSIVREGRMTFFDHAGHDKCSQQRTHNNQLAATLPYTLHILCKWSELIFSFMR